MGPRLFIRADASAKIGTGHVMRCMALAQAWNAQGGQTTLLFQSLSDSMKTHLKTKGVDLIELQVDPGSTEDAQKTSEVWKKDPFMPLVVDGYLFGPQFQDQLRRVKTPFLLVDDFGHCDAYSPQFLLNQNAHADRAFYQGKVSSDVQFLMGTSYSLIRPDEFKKWRSWVRKTRETAQRILVTYGGVDPQGMTLRTIQALMDLPANSVEIDCVVGGTNPQRQEIEEAAKQLPQRIEIECDVRNMPEKMAAADLALSAGGSTCWELAFMQLPTLTVVTVDNQLALAEGFERIGAGKNLGWHHELKNETLLSETHAILKDFSARQKMARAGRAAVDGLGCDRVIDALRSGKKN